MQGTHRGLEQDHRNLTALKKSDTTYLDPKKEQTMNKSIKHFALALILAFATLGFAHAESLMETNTAAGKAYLEKNAKVEGVKSTDSGLQYKVLREGRADGKKPGPTSTVKVMYEGRHLNGEIFDSSYQRGEPIEFPLNRVIPGWTEGLQLMQEGAKYQLTIPQHIAYGRRGAGRAIGPAETLIFDVELLEVK